MRLRRTAMRRSRKEKPPSLYISTSSRESSPSCSSVFSDWDADDEGFMSSGEFLPSRPLSLSIPGNAYCPRRPTLQEVLSNIAPPPWTLSAFMAYLSQNHCLETLEFTMDATRYRKHFEDMEWEGDASGTPISPTPRSSEYVRMLWQKLLDAYIQPNGPREVNLPSDVRDELLSLPTTQLMPPNPDSLLPAVRIIYDLMDESVLVPFLNSVSSARTPITWSVSNENLDAYMRGSLDERSLSQTRSRTRREHSPPLTVDVVSASYSGPPTRMSHQSHLSAALARGSVSRLSTYLSGSSTASSTNDAVDLTDDSTGSPSPSSQEPMTPPTTPPTSDLGFSGKISPSTSPRNTHRDNSSWKKMGQKLGWKKNRSLHGSNGSNSGKISTITDAEDESAS